jgi:carbon-monoxide dehydrogenase medium subunit
MHPASFAYLTPNTLPETFDLLDKYGDDAKLLAGGHSLIPAMKLRLATPSYLIDLGRVPGLTGIRFDGETLVIGALTVHADIESSELVRQRLPGLAYTAHVIGDRQVRNRGTIGGSVAHADPGADFPVMLTALNASFVATSRGGTRSISCDDFFVDVFTTALEPTEVLTEIRIPLPVRVAGTGYKKLGNPASGYVVISAGALIERGVDDSCATARVALGGVPGGPWRAGGTESALVGKPLTTEHIAAAAGLAADGAELDDDPYASAEYKREMLKVFAQRAIEMAVGEVSR